MMTPHSLAGPSMTTLLTRILAALPEPIIAPVPLETWRETVTAHYAGKAKSTRLRADQAVGWAIELAGEGATTADLTAGLVARYAGMTEGLRPATVDGRLRALRAATNLALVRRWIAESPFDGATPWPSLRSAPPLKSRHHSRADLARFLALLESESESWRGGRLHALGAVYAYCGLRRTEALRLRVEDVDFATGVVRVVRREKGLKTVASEAPVPMPGALARVLRRWVPRCGSEWLIPGVKRLGPWTGGMTGRKAGDQLRMAAERAGVAGLGPHTLRHSLATHLRGWWGLSPKQVQGILRHSNQWTQELYCHEDLANLGALVKDVDFASARTSRRSPAA